MADNVEIQGLEFQIIGDSVNAEDSLNKLKDKTLCPLHGQFYPVRAEQEETA